MKTIQDILDTNRHAVWSVTPNTSVKTALKRMAEEQVEAMPVLEAGKLVGVIYEKDCLTKVILNDRSTAETRVMEIMAPNIATVSPAQTVEECFDVMTEEHIQHIPVTAGASLLGFVSMSELYRTIIDDQKNYLYRLDNYVLGIDFGK